MRLAQVQIREYKSNRASNPFAVGDVTCLVGKNEAGKTALLEALYRLNPIRSAEGTFSITDDYPRGHVEDYRQAVESGERSPAVVIEADFTLDSEEVAAIEGEFGRGVLAPAPQVRASKGYANQLLVRVYLNESVAVTHLLGRVDLPPEVRERARKATTLKALAQALASFTAGAEEGNRLAESESSRQFRTELDSYTRTSLSDYVWSKHLQARFPQFLYFDEFYQMEGQVNIQQLKERETTRTLKASDLPMLGLLELSRLRLDDLIAARNTQEVINKLEGTSNHLSRQILKYWSQNKHLWIRFDMRQGLREDPEEMREGINLWGLVFDSAHQVTIRLGSRSRGFIWFFSFLAYFSRHRKAQRPLILLLDEPGLFLHASAQADSIRTTPAFRCA